MHLDVVPAHAPSWSMPPYCGEVVDDELWGRGAVDMKNMVAMCLSSLAGRIATGWRPRRDIVVALLADEETGGHDGAGWLVDDHPELFEGCTELIGEAGGFSHEIAPGRRAYLVQTAEKGITWLRLTGRGPGGHGSLIQEDGAVDRLVQALARLEKHRPVLRDADFTSNLVTHARDWTGVQDADQALAALGPVSKFLRPTLRKTFTVTGLNTPAAAMNVVPSEARASVDARSVPGFEQDLMAELAEVVGDLVDIEVVYAASGIQAPFSGPVPEAITQAYQREDPDAVVVPVCLPIGTDAKHFARLGIRGYGFVPLALPTGYDFASMFHGVDERIPVAALRRGVRTLDYFFDVC
jgi:acetylornithine deacetylase/succinyl-diaminopimelate desuccinylase-like protein